MPRKIMFKKIMLRLGCLVSVAGFVALCVLAVMHDNCLGPFLQTSGNQRCVEQRFAPAIASFAAMADWPTASGSPYLKGRAVPVDLGEPVVGWSTGLAGEPPTFTPNHVSHILHDLPKSIVAWKPDEVDTVILLVWKKDVIDHFPSGYAAYRSLCEVTVVDVAASAVVGRRTFRGGDPPEEKMMETKSDIGGTAPDDEIVEWIRALPRK